MGFKFDDCATCRFRRKRHICRDCEVGELYEDEDSLGVDDMIREVPSRFGESVSADETPERRFDADKFLDGFQSDDEPEDTKDESDDEDE